LCGKWEGKDSEKGGGREKGGRLFGGRKGGGREESGGRRGGERVRVAHLLLETLTGKHPPPWVRIFEKYINFK
jgi:hypothetical protein